MDDFRKREIRVLQSLPELLDIVSQLEFDLNYIADYIGSEKLFEAKKHATSIYHILNNVEKSLTSESI